MTPDTALAHSLGTMALVSLTSLSSPQCLLSADSVLCLKDGALQKVLSRVSYSKGRASQCNSSWAILEVGEDIMHDIMKSTLKLRGYIMG